jgi:hypothetical protein
MAALRVAAPPVAAASVDHAPLQLLRVAAAPVAAVTVML